MRVWYPAPFLSFHPEIGGTRPVIIFFSFGYSHNGVSYPFPPPTLHIPSCLHHILLHNNVSNRYLFKFLISEKSLLRYSGGSEMVLICPFNNAPNPKTRHRRLSYLMILKVNSPQINTSFTVSFRKIVRRDRKISHLTYFYINLISLLIAPVYHK